MYRTNVLRKVREQRLLHDVTVELTYACNLDCFYCYNDRAKQGTPLSLAQYRSLFEDLARLQTLFVMLTGGEPMVHPHFFEIGAMTKELGFVVRIRTNGHTLHRRNVERLKREVDPYAVEVTLHGATAEVHDRQTRVSGSFARLIRNLRGAREAGLRCSMVVTPTAWNERQVEAMMVLGDEIDVPLRFQGPVAPRDNGDLEPLSLQPSRSTWDGIEALVEQRRTSHQGGSRARPQPEVAANAGAEVPATCGIGAAGLDIDPFGNVRACMHLQESAGSLHEQSIEEIWHHSPLFARARQRAIGAAASFGDGPRRQFGAPLFCLAVEENCSKEGQGCRRP